MSKITLYVCRHGKTMMNTLDKVQGWCDSPLTQEGIDVARYLGYGLQDIKFRSAYCSDLRRTRQTAQVVLEAARQDNITITEMPEFREACFGSYEADWNEVMWGHAALFLQYTSPKEMYEDIVNMKITYREVLNTIKRLDKMGIAEDFNQLEARTQKGLREIAEKEVLNGEGNILLIAHGMSIVGMLLGLGGDKFGVGMLDNAAVCKVSYENGHFTVESMGDMNYVHHGRKLATGK